jgi:hypothetical protein
MRFFLFYFSFKKLKDNYLKIFRLVFYEKNKGSPKQAFVAFSNREKQYKY